MKIGARYAALLRSRLSRWDEKTRLSVRITGAFMMTSRGSLWRIAFAARLSYSVIVSIARSGFRKKDPVSSSSLASCIQVSGKGLFPRFIERHGAVLTATPQAHVSYSNRYDINQLGERRSHDHGPQPSGGVLAYIARGRKGILRSMVAKYDLVKEAGFLDENHYHYDGFILTLRLAKLTPFVYLPDPLMEKREHAGGTSKGISFSEKERYFQGVLAEVMRVTDELPEKDKRTIRENWLEKILELSVKAKMEQGDWSGAWMEIARRLARDPRRIKASLKMARNILSRAGHT